MVATTGSRADLRQDDTVLAAAYRCPLSAAANRKDMLALRFAGFDPFVRPTTLLSAQRSFGSPTMW